MGIEANYVCPNTHGMAFSRKGLSSEHEKVPIPMGTHQLKLDFARPVRDNETGYNHMIG